MSAKTLSAVESLERIESSVEKIKSDAKQRFPEAASAEDTWRQGDVYITLLNAIPDDCSKVDKPQKQVAPGNTQGSRHILDSLRGVKIFQRPNATPLQGPIMRFAEERTLTHPEHGDVVCPPGVYEITYQRAFADELRRVQD